MIWAANPGGSQVDLPPLDDDRWHVLLAAVMHADDRDDVTERDRPVIDLRGSVVVQPRAEEPSGRRNSSSS